MKFYKTKAKKIPGTSFSEVNKGAQRIFKNIKRQSKRNPYVKSVYFRKEKVFFNIFWSHLYEKQNLNDKTRRLKYFACAVELIQKTTHEPEQRKPLEDKNVVLYRFAGATNNNELFFVQIKEDLKTKKKYFISVFPE